MTGPDRAGEDYVLVQRYLAGDARAFDRLMAAHEGRVFAVCLRILADREEALDATQETFITVLRKAGSFQGRSAFGTWLYRVAVNTCYSMLRSRGRRPTVPLPETHDPPDVSALDNLRSAEIRPMLETALANLPEEFGPAVILSDLEGLPLRTVAEILEVPLGTVKSRVFRGRKLLATQLGNLAAPSGRPREDMYE